MAAVCDVCGKRPGFGHNVPWSKKKTNRRWNPNIQRVTRHRVRQPQAAQRLHLVHQGRQSNPLTSPGTPAQAPSLACVSQAWMTTGMIIGRRRCVSLTHLPSCRLITC